jgi:hypothetical protein
VKRKPGRPKLPKGEAKGKIVPIRFTKQLKRAGAADMPILLALKGSARRG